MRLESAEEGDSDANVGGVVGKRMGDGIKLFSTPLASYTIIPLACAPNRLKYFKIKILHAVSPSPLFLQQYCNISFTNNFVRL